MTKFHDEFFKKGSSEHDELVLKCASEEGKLKIAKIVEKTMRLAPLPTEGMNYGKNEIMICDCGNTPLCKRDKSIAWNSCKEINKNCAFADKWSSYWVDSCEYFDKSKMPTPTKKQGEHQEVQLCPQGDSKRTIAPLIVQSSAIYIPHEVEVLCKAGNDFIIGYADLLLKVRRAYTLMVDLTEISDGWFWKNYHVEEMPAIKILVEVKPEIKEIGSVLRQLKTYMNILQVEYGAIATYSAIQPELIDLLKDEKIAVVKFDKNMIGSKEL